MRKGMVEKEVREWSESERRGWRVGEEVIYIASAVAMVSSQCVGLATQVPSLDSRADPTSEPSLSSYQSRYPDVNRAP